MERLVERTCIHTLVDGYRIFIKDWMTLNINVTGKITRVTADCPSEPMVHKDYSI